MKRCFIIIVLLTLVYGSLSAQNEKQANPTYRTALGLRYSPFGISFKSNFITRKRSFEIVGYFKDGFTGSGLYYWNFDLNQARNLKAYAGFNGQVGFQNDQNGGDVIFGAGGVIGLDYKFLNLPLNLSLDWQPAFQLGGNKDFNGYGGLAARFTL